MIPRIYIDAPITPGPLVLSTEHAHYLRNVLRRAEGAQLRVFNATDGEFAAILGETGRKGAMAQVLKRTRSPEAPPELILIFAPVKRSPTETIIEKATELGVGAFQPVLTERTNSDRLNISRLAIIAREAAEQSGRLSVPEFREAVRLPQLLASQTQARPIYFCDEAGDNPTEPWGGPGGRARPMLEAVVPDAGAAAILTGPEGGFSPDERRVLRETTGVVPVSLGPRILRADTAVIAAITLWQAAAGDLRKP